MVACTAADKRLIMLWLKSFHLIFVICWFAGLFYLPRLFVYHAMSDDAISLARFKIMERKLLYGIMTPSAVLALITGIWLLSNNMGYYLHCHWMLVKLVSVFLLLVYHGYCLFYYDQFKQDRNTHSHIFYRCFNELPVFGLFLIVIMVIVRPNL
jgi:putative membrane protein